MKKKNEKAEMPTNMFPAQSNEISSEPTKITAERALWKEYLDKVAATPPLPAIEVQKDAKTGKLNYAMPKKERVKYFMAKAAMSKATGTAHDALAKELIAQATQAVPPKNGQEQHNLESIIGALMEISPQNGLEAMLGVQLVTTHKLAMHSLSGVNAAGQSPLGADMRIAQAARLMRLFNQQMETLHKYRTRGQPQRIRIERVNISGGQAIVGSSVQKGEGQSE
jgi:hypothetical protein